MITDKEQRMKQDLSDLKRANMDTVIVEKARLKATLVENRAAHRATFEAALEGYKVRALELLKEHIARIKSGTVERVYVSLPAPQEHIEDYDRAIAMLEWTIFEEVTLTISEFDWYVRDAWNWKGEFAATSAMYTGSGRET